MTLTSASPTAQNGSLVVFFDLGDTLPQVSTAFAEALYNGVQGADILPGAVNPGGRLPYTIAKARKDPPADIQYESSAQPPQMTCSEGLDIDYR
jgi:hypothetical protein